MQNVTDIAVLLPGVWSLKRFFQRAKDGKIGYPLGENLVGQLIYTRDNRVSLSMMNSDATAVGISFEELIGLKRLDPRYLRGSTAYAQSAVRYAALAGAYRVDGATVVHEVESSFFPDWVGTQLVRRVEFGNDGTLTLSYTDSLGAEVFLSWARSAAADEL